MREEEGARKGCYALAGTENLKESRKPPNVCEIEKGNLKKEV